MDKSAGRCIDVKTADTNGVKIIPVMAPRRSRNVISIIHDSYEFIKILADVMHTSLI